MFTVAFGRGFLRVGYYVLRNCNAGLANAVYVAVDFMTRAARFRGHLFRLTEGCRLAVLVYCAAHSWAKVAGVRRDSVNRVS